MNKDFILQMVPNEYTSSFPSDYDIFWKYGRRGSQLVGFSTETDISIFPVIWIFTN